MLIFYGLWINKDYYGSWWHIWSLGKVAGHFFMHFCDQFEGKKEEMDYDIEVLSAVWIYTLA